MWYPVCRDWVTRYTDVLVCAQIGFWPLYACMHAYLLTSQTCMDTNVQCTVKHPWMHTSVCIHKCMRRTCMDTCRYQGHTSCAYTNICAESVGMRRYASGHNEDMRTNSRTLKQTSTRSNKQTNKQTNKRRICTC